MYISTNIANQTCLRLLKRFNLFIFCCILAFTSPLCVRASEPTATPGGSSTGDYVTVEIPLTWTRDKLINLETGLEEDDNLTSVTGFISVIPDAQYQVSISRKGVSNGCIAFFYTPQREYIQYQSLWLNQSTLQSVGMYPPTNSGYFRLSSSITVNQNDTQDLITLAITVSATYLEENNLTEETLLDVVYKDDDRSIADASDAFIDEYEQLHISENYLLEESTNAFDDFFASFSWSDLAEYASGFQFIGSWFSNFYNSHSAVAVSVGMASGLVILFILLRFRGS